MEGRRYSGRRPTAQRFRSTTPNQPRAKGVRRRVGCIWWLARLAARPRALRHERPQHGVDAGLIPGPLCLEPIKHVSVDPERNRPFRYRLDDLRRSPEVVWQPTQLSGRRALNRRVRDPPQPG